MLIGRKRLSLLVVFAAICRLTTDGFSQETVTPAGDAPARAKAAFDKSFSDYKEVIRQIEQMRIDYQTANAATRAKINTDLTGHVAHAQTLANTMVDAGMEAFRLAPSANPQVTELLTGVAKHYAVGQQIGPGESKSGGRDLFYPIEGGDQYERALPIIKRLLEGGAENGDLYVWGFLCAFNTNDYELATEYLKKAQESGALDALAKTAQNETDPQAGLSRIVFESLMKYSSAIDKYRELWAKESALRKAEAVADNLPRVRFVTTKGVITIELFENEAPQSVANLITLIKQGYYDGSPFHRVLPQFMVQGGAKTDDGVGGPGYKIRCECYRPDYRHHFRGSLSMAHAGRDTGSSQFFLTLVPTTHLDGKHTVFGRVIEGIEVLGDLQKRSPQHQAHPPQADRIIKAEVLRSRGHEYKFERLKE